MDKADPVLIGHLCVGDLHLFPIDVDLALRGGECAGQHIHQGGFACAVFAQQPDDIPRGNGEIHMVHGAHRPKVHHDALHFYEHVPVLPSSKISRSLPIGVPGREVPAENRGSLRALFCKLLPSVGRGMQDEMPAANPARCGASPYQLRASMPY